MHTNYSNHRNSRTSVMIYKGLKICNFDFFQVKWLTDRQYLTAVGWLDECCKKYQWPLVQVGYKSNFSIFLIPMNLGAVLFLKMSADMKSITNTHRATFCKTMSKYLWYFGNHLFQKWKTDTITMWLISISPNPWIANCEKQTVKIFWGNDFSNILQIAWRGMISYKLFVWNQLALNSSPKRSHLAASL